MAQRTASLGVARDGSEPHYAIPAVERALGVIELLAGRSERLGVTAIARELGIPKSSCFSILSTLETAGYVMRQSDQTWSLTLKVYFVGMRAGQSVDILAVAKPVLERLAAKTQLTTHLGLRDGAGVVYAQKIEPPGFVRFETYPGKRASLHLTALARAIVANLPAAEQEQILHGYRFEGGTTRAVTARKEFDRLLGETCRHGYAFEQEEETSGVSCVAAPVFGHSGAVVAAVGVTGLASQVKPASVDELAAQVMADAHAITELLTR